MKYNGKTVETAAFASDQVQGGESDVLKKVIDLRYEDGTTGQVRLDRLGIEKSTFAAQAVSASEKSVEREELIDGLKEALEIQ